MKTVNSNTELISEAKRITRKHNIFMFCLGRILLSLKYFPLFCLCYAYFRWLDDKVDSSNISEPEISHLINRQKRIIDSIILGSQEQIDDLCASEQMLALLLIDKQNSRNLKKSVLEMLSAIEFDAERRHKVINKDALENYSRKVGGAFAEFLVNCISPSLVHVNPIDDIRVAAYSAHRIHVLRDFYDDLKRGYINISKEELRKLGTQVDSLQEIDLRPWVRDRVQISSQEFQKSLPTISCIKNTKCRILGLFTSARYLVILEKIKFDGYILQKEYNISIQEYISIVRWVLYLSVCKPTEINGILGQSRQKIGIG
jgi:phytoene/squalene synthetase